MINLTGTDNARIDFANDAKVGRAFLDLVTDKVLRSMLFGTDINDPNPEPEDMDIEASGIILIMKRALNVAYIIALTRWKQLLDTLHSWSGGKKNEINHFNNSRFTKLFQNAMLGEDISTDLQIFSLLELWVDLKKTNLLIREAFGSIFDFTVEGDSIGRTLQELRDTLKNVSFKSNYTGKYTKKACNELCYRLLRAFTVFSDAKVTYPEDSRINDDYDFSITYENCKKDVVLYPNTLFKADGEKSCLRKFIVTDRQLKLLTGEAETVNPPRVLSVYMRIEKSYFNGKLQQRYRALDDRADWYVQTEVVQELPKEERLVRDMHETRKFMSFSYKNIREFAMIINDSLSKAHAKRKDLFDLCKQNYPRILGSLKTFDAEELSDAQNTANIYWDNIITLMLLEMGVEDFLEVILCEEGIFDDVMTNIDWRNKGGNSNSALMEAYRKKVGKLSKTRSTVMFDKQVLELRIQTVLKAMNFDTEDDDPYNPFLESLSYKYGNIVSCIQTLTVNKYSDEGMESAETLTDIFRDIFMFLKVFYVGLYGYAEKKMLLESASEDKKIDDIRDQCWKAFKDAASDELNKVQDLSLEEMFDDFCNLCEQYGTFSGESPLVTLDKNGREKMSKASVLKYVITRNYICDANKLRLFATVDLDSGKHTTIFKVLGNLQAYRKESHLDEWFNYLKDIFMFLIYNEDYNQRGLWNVGGEPLQDQDCDPVYPYIVTYYKENIDRNHVKKCSYRVPLPVAKDESEAYVVTLLTDEDYNPDTYYCIPLRYGSSDRWWINPFLIPKKVIQEIGYPQEEK